MTETPLDHAYAQMQADPDAQTPRMRFYDRLLGAELFVLLECPMAAGQDRIEPQILTSEGASFVLAFDREERLSQFVDGVEAPYAALTGRALAKMLAPQDIGLGLNLRVAPSETLLD
ncbi:MAG: SseB family protein, partial [Paracoccaceae bacterium]